jgi:hypothetical protein
MQKIKIAPFVRLRYTLREERAIPTLIMRCRPHPIRAPRLENLIVDEQLQTPLRHIELDQIAIFNERKRPANEALR